MVGITGGGGGGEQPSSGVPLSNLLPPLSGGVESLVSSRVRDFLLPSSGVTGNLFSSSGGLMIFIGGGYGGGFGVLSIEVRA